MDTIDQSTYSESPIDVVPFSSKQEIDIDMLTSDQRDQIMASISLNMASIESNMASIESNKEHNNSDEDDDDEFPLEQMRGFEDDEEVKKEEDNNEYNSQDDDERDEFDIHIEGYDENFEFNKSKKEKGE